MRHFAREIEADLLFRGIDIFDWHRGEMSSRRLLALVDALPDDCAYHCARREGDWSLKEYLIAAQVNELRRLRADQAAIHTQKEMKVHMIESPAQEKEQEADADKRLQVRNHLLSQLKGKKTTE